MGNRSHMWRRYEASLAAKKGSTDYLDMSDNAMFEPPPPPDVVKSPAVVKKDLVMIKFDEICNLGYVPMSLHTNPLYKTALDFLAKNPSKKKSFLMKHYRMIDKVHNDRGLNLSDLMKVFSSEPREIKPLISHKPNVCFLPWSMKKPMGRNYFVKHWRAFRTLSAEDTRLLNILKSMKKKGYRPNDFIVTSMAESKGEEISELLKDSRGHMAEKLQGHHHRRGHVTCHFIKNSENKRRVFITTGHHRVAAFFALWPDKEMPAILDHASMFAKNKMHKSFKAEYDIADSATWPSVSKGFMSQKDAEYIFNCYFSTDDCAWFHSNSSPWPPVLIGVDGHGSK